MTSMDQIQIIAERARAAGTTYGKYVALHPDALPSPESMRDYRKCADCGEFFLPRRNKDGNFSAQARCMVCLEIAREKRREGKSSRTVKRSKIYIRPCTICGKDVETRQPPNGRNLYCSGCRKTVKYVKKEK